jgi:hypothetical protein
MRTETGTNIWSAMRMNKCLVIITEGETIGFKKLLND